jgi:sulfoxide reductase heme-binding subunit YedZ
MSETSGLGTLPAAAEKVARGAPPAGKGVAGPPKARRHSIADRIKNAPWLPWLVRGLALLPFLWVALALASDAFQGTRYLGSEPVKESEHFTGKWALRFLLLTLAVTPAIKWTQWGWMIRYRRMFGLFAFFYAGVHLTIYFGLDIELMWDNLVEDVLDRTYITLGMTALVLLLPLALTSSKASIRRLGNKRWTALHRLVYVSTVLGCVHFYMAVKRDVREPLVYAAIAVGLLAYRVVARRRSPPSLRRGRVVAA